MLDFDEVFAVDYDSAFILVAVERANLLFQFFCLPTYSLDIRGSYSRIHFYLSISKGYICDSVMTMPVKFKIKVVQVGNSLRVTIPKEIAEFMKLRKGDIVEMWADDSHLIVEKGDLKDA